MRIPLPERFAPRHVIIFAILLFLAEIFVGTNLTFALLVFAYVCLFALAFNLAGGIFFPSGAWILFTGTETCIVGLVYKLLLREPAESNLKTPIVTMAVYALGMGGTAVAAYVTAAFRPKKGLLADIGVGRKMYQSAAGCLFFGVVIVMLSGNASHETATYVSALAQLNHFPQMAILLGTVYQIQSSKGKSSTNWIVWTSGLILFYFGLKDFSKEPMFIGVTVWLIPCIVLKYEFKKLQVVFLAGALFFMVYYLVPYSQYGRQSRTGVDAEQSAAMYMYLQELPEVRRMYLDSAEVSEVANGPHFYDSAQGLMDRLQMLAIDDALIDYTNYGNYVGLAPTYQGFFNAIPRFLWPEKPVYGAGNDYGKQIGVISSDDTSTGISFSPVGDSYHQVGWYGPLLLLPLVFMLMFLVTDSLAGDVRKSPWGLLFIALSVHAAPEGLLAGCIYTATFGAEAVIFAAVLSAMVFPKLVTLVLGGERTRVRKGRDFRPSPSSLRMRQILLDSGIDAGPAT